MRLIVCLLAALALLFGAVACRAQAAAPALYVYGGNGCNVAAQNAALRNMLGRKEDGGVVFIDYSQTPGYAYSNADYGLGCYKGQEPNIALSVPLGFVKPSTGEFGLTKGAYTLADVAAGKLDAFFAHVAQSAVSHGFPKAHMRLGWEMNGNWYVWAAHGREATFNAAFCHVKSVMQSAAPSARFTFWLNPTTNGDATGEMPSCISPVDSGVAWDQYESWWTTHGAKMAPVTWSNALLSWWGIDSIASWGGSARHAVPEFGVGAPVDASGRTSTDAAAFMASLLAYDAAHGAEFMGLWDSNSAYAGRISDGSKPGEALELLKVYGPGKVTPYLVGARRYDGPLSVSTPGLVHVLAQLANGHIALLAWAPGTVAVDSQITLSQARTLTCEHADGSTKACGRATSFRYVAKPLSIEWVDLSGS